ncbi:MAG: Excinuclease ABC C subunit domain protein [candidate division WWE3 bacterium GW2011_GWB1_42_41]|nr:MAG: Excinuclease ABC C subunit domain protein [candidate division WWE3 bacterium GW2011_GWB1_42_41]KKS73082.1 MAG: Excinuclease ABC C subunit domain protein [candidate division WWE3 bacterium GW2011_GWD1_42_70]
MVSSNLKEKLKDLPTTPGVYIYEDAGGEIIYVGKAKNLRSRVSSYFRLNLDKSSKTFALVEKTNDMRFIEVDSELEALILEAELIKKHLPQFNISLKDDKSYLYVGIKSEKVDLDGKATNIQKIETFRKPDTTKYQYFYGPFPDGGSVKQLVRTLRKILPFRDCSVAKYNKYKKLGTPCLYGHINLCPAPCVNGSAIMPVYKNNIKAIKSILSGKTSKLINALEKQMRSFATSENFEKAAEIRNTLNKFNYVRQSFRLPAEYIENPYLLDDLAKSALEDLVKIVPVIKQLPTRIECYDISNISGKEAVGSMVTAINGRIDKREYKRFKIRTKNTADDFFMIREVIYRRLSHETNEKKNSWGLPSLVVLDGGKGQLSSAMEAMTKLNLDIPMIGLAKKEETVVYYDNGFYGINPGVDSPGMRLLINLRDESHRFAQKYHHMLRSKKIFGPSQ